MWAFQKAYWGCGTSFEDILSYSFLTVYYLLNTKAFKEYAEQELKALEETEYACL
jgi:hypothetical protein